MTQHLGDVHTPVLLEEVLSIFKTQNGDQIRLFVDATLGAGGHAAAILHDHAEIEHFIGVDRDFSAIQIAQKRLQCRLKPLASANFWHCRFEQISERLESTGALCDAILVDLGVSSMQLDDFERGFSHRGDGPLDMRMDQSQRLTAVQIVNRLSERELTALLRAGEVRSAHRIAHAICRARREAPIATAGQLLRAVAPQLRGKSKSSAASLLFQALRIAVNGELEYLGRTLWELAHRLSYGGKLVTIAFHSLEDRIVKQSLRALGKTEQFRILTPKPLTPSLRERGRNRRCRSAKLRAIARCGDRDTGAA